MECKQKDWFGPQRLYLGIDVGRPFLRAVGLKLGGTIEISYRQNRCQENIEALLDEAESGALVNCGPEEQHRLAYRAQVVREGDRRWIPFRKGDEVRRGMFPGTAKNDRTVSPVNIMDREISDFLCGLHRLWIVRKASLETLEELLHHLCRHAISYGLMRAEAVVV